MAKNMNDATYVGIAAALLTTFGFVPQIIKMYKNKSAKDVSIMTLIQFGIGVSLWIIYGIYIEDYIIIISNVMTVMTLLMAIILYYHYNYLG